MYGVSDTSGAGRTYGSTGPVNVVDTDPRTSAAANEFVEQKFENALAGMKREAHKNLIDLLMKF